MVLDFVEADRRLREGFGAGDGRGGGEYQLKCDVVLRPPAELAAFSLVILDEWEPSPGWTQDGKGDLVFTDGEGRFVVVEVKWMDGYSSGRTALRRRTRKRGKVRDQALRYAQAVWKWFPDAHEVGAAVFTNDPGDPGLSWLPSVPPPPVPMEALGETAAAANPEPGTP